jgi:hypothetical protein
MEITPAGRLRHQVGFWGPTKLPTAHTGTAPPFLKKLFYYAVFFIPTGSA